MMWIIAAATLIVLEFVAFLVWLRYEPKYHNQEEEMPLTAQDHIRKFEKDWMLELISDHPEVGQDELYHDGLQAYMASEDMSAETRREISRMTGVPVGF